MKDQFIIGINYSPREKGDRIGPLSWIDLNRQEFWTSPREHLPRIYGRFKEIQ